MLGCSDAEHLRETCYKTQRMTRPSGGPKPPAIQTQLEGRANPVKQNPNTS